MNADKLAEIDLAVDAGLQAHKMPGCVVLIARRGTIVFLKAYGHRQIEPERVAMTTDTVFDLASLTKPIATATSGLLLVQEGKLRLDDPVAKHCPEFGQNGKEHVTIYELLTHQGGLTPDNALRDYEDGPARAWERICALQLLAEPGTKFVYSDVGFIVLGEIVRRVSGQNLHEFSQTRVFRPLGMSETSFLPCPQAQPKDNSLAPVLEGEGRGEGREGKHRSNDSAVPQPCGPNSQSGRDGSENHPTWGELVRRAAPTERREGRWMHGEVHDPRAYLLGGIAGHAGLFSTAEDLAVYAQMLLGGGTYAGVRVLEERTVALMTSGYPVPKGLRGLGWDVRTGYSSNRGETFTPRAFGHGGFTGTGLWIDPGLELTVIFLSHRLHPDGQGAVNPLIGRIGTLAANAIEDRPQPAVLTGIDVLERDAFRQLAGRHVGLITNQTGVSRQGRSTAELLHKAKQVELVALFSPEHGWQGKLDVARIADAHDEVTGLPIYSLYGESRRPSDKSLLGLDTLVFDIQDIGTRFYTYISTMGLAMQTAAEAKLRFVVLDRPNPLGGVEVAGPVLDAGAESFVGFHRLPVQHGMTVGELARMFNTELRIGVDLQVISIKGWRRSATFEQTGLPWVNPSPNMRSPTEASLYPGIGLLETTNLSVGRGTEIPFEVVGAPWLDGSKLADALNALQMSGVYFVPIVFAPTASKFTDERCGGVRLVLTNRRVYRSVHTGLQVARQLRVLYPQDWKAEDYAKLLGHQRVLEALLKGRSITEIESFYEVGLAEFRQRRKGFLLYD
ncbi:MAG: DUF1343 domain-containing protein [Planctomycetota bacterium]|nr:DUF1343 domain-containing protein [Planctomycetota bacterium]